MTNNEPLDPEDEAAGNAADPGVLSVGQDEFDDDGLGGDSRGGVSSAEEPGDHDEGDVTGTRTPDEDDAGPDVDEPDLVVRVAED